MAGTATKKAGRRRVAPEGESVCGFCAGAPMARDRELNHLRCIGEACRCAALDHDPDDVVREAQAHYNRLTSVVCRQRDPGVHPDNPRAALVRAIVQDHEVSTGAAIGMQHLAHEWEREAQEMSRATLNEHLRVLGITGAARLGIAKAVQQYVDAQLRNAVDRHLGVVRDRAEALASARR